MTDTGYGTRLRRALSTVSAGLSLRPMTEADQALPPHAVTGAGDQRLLPLPELGWTLVCEASEPGADRLLRLAALLAEECCARHSGRPSHQERWQAWLSGGEIPESFPEGPHCAIALRVQEGMPPGGLRELIPLQRGDSLVETGETQAALILGMTGNRSQGELTEYVQALQTTLLEEAGCDLRIGVSDPFHGAEALAGAWRQAQSALEIGLEFRPGESLFFWSRLAEERILSELTPEQAAGYAALLFNRRTARLFDEEMLETIDTFIDKDLNLSDTARQMYIHRNTLVYRLDKVQRVTGLDLRRFDDAVTFRLLSQLRRRAAAHNESGNRRVP